MTAKYLDQDIMAFIQEPKIAPDHFRKRIKLRDKRGHKEQEIDIVGETGNQYLLILRESLFTTLDFSVILGIYPADTTQLFRLRRYNGKHEHTNHIEKHKFFDFHIHTATERYQERGAREDAFAEVTDRYVDLLSALECMIEDCNFQLSEQEKLPLFDGI